MTTKVRCCAPNDPVTKAAQIMAEVNCGCVPVVEGDQVVGMLTDRDIVLRGVAKGKETNNCTCSDCMTATVITCAPEMDAHKAADLMAEKQIRRLPVVENGRLCGIIALGDMATVHIHVDEAGEALSQISEPAQPGAH
jgi:CBS domain-containing protein